VIDRGREFVNETRRGQLGIRLESALLSEEALCLLLVGDEEDAKSLVDLIAGRDDLDAEAIVSAAYLKAVFQQPFEEKTVIPVFEDALSRLSQKDSGKAHTRAAIALFRGKLLERLGDLDRAEASFDDACQRDHFNLHMKICLLKVAMNRLKRIWRQGESPVARAIAQRCLSVAKEILKINPNEKTARSAQEDLFADFNIS
jgi:hypothetical protein